MEAFLSTLAGGTVGGLVAIGWLVVAGEVGRRLARRRLKREYDQLFGGTASRRKSDRSRTN